MMTYEESWNVLAHMLTELRKRGEVIPTDLMEDLRSAKTMIQVLKADPSHIENIPRIEAFLLNVESRLVFMAQERFGSKFVDEWLKKLEKARKTVKEKGEAAQRSVSGLPRGKHWMRVKVSEESPRKRIETLAEQ